MVGNAAFIVSAEISELQTRNKEKTQNTTLHPQETWRENFE